MKKYKQLLSMILAVLLLLNASSTVPPDPTNTELTKTTEATDEKPPFTIRPLPWEIVTDSATVDMKINCQYLPQVVDNPDNLPVLKWVCLPDYFTEGKYGSIWSEAAAIEVNQMLADRNMPFRLQFVIYTSDFFSKGDYNDIDWFARPEAQADLATADLLFAGYMTASRAKEYYMPLTEYIRGNAAPSLKNAVPHEINWKQSSVNGEIYGISQRVRRAFSRGWVVDADVLTEHGMTIEDFQKNYWEMDDTLKKLSEVSGNRKLIKIPANASLEGMFEISTGVEQISPGIVGSPMNRYFTGIGSVFAVEYINDAPAVVNTLNTETAHKIQDAVIRYRDKYAAPDDGSVDAKLYFNSTYGHQPYQRKFADTGEAYWYIPVSKSYYNTSESVIQENVSGVAATSKYQKEAVALLSLIAEDEEFRMHLMYGKEGRDYTIDENGNYCVTKQEDGSRYCMSYLSPWSNFSGMNKNHSRFPGTGIVLSLYEGMTVLETYLEMLENAEPYYAVPFDFSELKEERKAVEYICQLYFYRFASLTEEKYAEMLEKINAAGGEKIMTELQKQLDEWVKANPDKPVTPRR